MGGFQDGRLINLNATTQRQSKETMTSVSAIQIKLTPIQPVGSGRPEQGSNPRPPYHNPRALPTELPPPHPCIRKKGRREEREEEGEEREREREAESETEREIKGGREEQRIIFVVSYHGMLTQHFFIKGRDYRVSSKILIRTNAQIHTKENHRFFQKFSGIVVVFFCMCFARIINI